MLTLTETQIIKQSTLENYIKGKDLYLKKLFKYDDIRITNQDNENQIYSYTASFNEGTKLYNLFINIHKTHGILYYDCECSHFKGFYDGMCPHLIALALTIANHFNALDINEKETKEQLNLLHNEQKLTEISKDNLILDSIINQFETIEKNYINNVHIDPFINTSNDTLAIKIGTNYMYTVFNINLFIKNIHEENYYQYGQKLSFVHESNSFDYESKQLVNLLKKVTTPSLIDNHYLKINKYTLEQIFEIYKESTININNINTYITNETYKINVKLTEKLTLESTISNFQIIKGYTKDFILIDQKLYILDSTNKDIYPLIDYLKNHKKININNSLENFLKNLYPRIYDKIEVTSSFQEKYPVVKLIIDSYIDYVNSTITIKPLYEMLNLKTSNAIYDTNKENAYYEELKALGFYKKNDTYIIDDPEEITRFLGSNLDNLKEFGTVFISDSLKAINVNIATPRISVSYNVNMMDVCFDDFNYTNEELYEIYNAYKKQKRFVILKDGAISKISDEFYQVFSLVDDLKLNTRKLNQTQSIPLYLAMKTQESIYINHSNEIKDMFNNLINYSLCDITIKNEYKDILRPYQLDGYKWLKTLEKYSFGGILADDMGLGKTLQIIASINNDYDNKPSLIICPTSLTYNWQTEIDKWAPNMKRIIINGPASNRYNIINNISDEKIIYITSYDSLRRDVDFYTNTFRYIILDEAQYIKNFFTQKAQAVKSLNSDFKFALTGTPIENSLLDLWSIFDFLMPDYLEPYQTFKVKYTTSVEDERLENLSKKVKPFILRRTKKDVLTELPDKFEIIRVAQMKPEQRKIYEAFLLKAREAIIKCDNTISILSLLTRLRQLCVDPKLFLNDYLGGSCKIDLCLEIVNEAIINDHRILIFSQFKSLFPIIEERLKEKNINFLKLTGDTPSNERLELVNTFNNNENIKVFLISLKAGGTGLNLVGADTVIHFDPWWNVAAENQATDRAHRIGQKKIVQVNKLICENSIEQKVIELQNSKKELSDKIVNEDSLNKLTEADIKYLLS